MPTNGIYVDGQLVLPQERTGTTVSWDYVDGQLGGLPAGQPTELPGDDVTVSDGGVVGVLTENTELRQAITVTENAVAQTLAVDLTTTVSDTLTVLDDVQTGGLLLQVSSDTATVTDAVTLGGQLFVTSVESTGVTDHVLAALTPLVASVEETLTVLDSATGETLLAIEPVYVVVTDSWSVWFEAVG